MLPRGRWHQRRYLAARRGERALRGRILTSVGLVARARGTSQAKVSSGVLPPPHPFEHTRDGLVGQRVDSRVQSGLQDVVVQSVDQLVELGAHAPRAWQTHVPPAQS